MTPLKAIYKSNKTSGAAGLKGQTRGDVKEERLAAAGRESDARRQEDDTGAPICIIIARTQPQLTPSPEDNETKAERLEASIRQW